MRVIKINLDDKVFNELEKAKLESGLSWEKFIINSVIVEDKE